MNGGPRFLVLLLTASAIPAASSLLDQRLQRLRTIPVAERAELEANLNRFHRLPPDRREAIRQLDQELERLPEAEKDRLLRTLLRYRNWLDTLPEELRKQIVEAKPARRMDLVAEIRGAAPPPHPLDRTRWIRSTSFNPIPLFEAHYLLKIWSSLSQGQRSQVERQPSLRDRQAMLEDLGRQLGVERDPSLIEEFRAGVDDLRRRLGARAGELRLGPDELLRPWPASDRTGPAAKAQAQAERVRGLVLRNLEARWSSSPAGQIAPAPPAELSAFEARLPAWYRETLDPLPAEIALDRLNRLYHLVGRDPALLKSLLAPPETPRASPGIARPPSGAATPF